MPNDHRSLHMPILLAACLVFSVLAKGAHDIWAASLVYLILLILFVMSLVWRSRRSEPEPFAFPFWPFVALVIGAFVISYARSIRPEESYLEVMDLLSFFAAFFLAANEIQDANRRSIFVDLVAPLFLIQTGLNMSQWIRFQPSLFFGQLSGSLINPNFSSAFHLLWLPVVLDWWQQSRPAKGAVFVYRSGVFACLSANIFMSGSVMGMGLFFLILFLNFRRSALVAALGVFTVVAIGWLQTNAYRGSALLSLDRFGWWSTGIRMFLDHPWFGTGPGTYGSAYLAYKIGHTQNTLYAHSVPLTLLAETGLAGILSVGAFLFTVSKRMKAAWLEPSLRPFATGLLLLGVFSLFNISLEILSNMVAAGLFLGIVLSRSSSGGRKLQRWAIFVLVGFAVVGTSFVVAPFVASQQAVMGYEALDAGEIEKAKKSFETAIGLDRRSSSAHEGLARAYAAEKKWAEAAIAQRHAIDLNKLNGFYWWELGMFLESGGEIEGARTAYQRAHDLHPANQRYQNDLQRLLR